MTYIYIEADLYIYLSTSLSLAGNLGGFTGVRHSSRRSSSIHCYQMLMHTIAHRGCVTSIRESALEADSGKKSLAAPGIRTRVSTAPDILVDALPTELSAPWHLAAFAIDCVQNCLLPAIWWLASGTGTEECSACH